jgi:hypothetical protein
MHDKLLCWLLIAQCAMIIRCDKFLICLLGFSLAHGDHSLALGQIVYLPDCRCCSENVFRGPGNLLNCSWEGQLNPLLKTCIISLCPFFEALLKGEVVLPRSVRLRLVKTWLPVVPKLCLGQDDRCGKALARSFENSVRDVVETLPIVEQMMIFQDLDSQLFQY